MGRWQPLLRWLLACSPPTAASCHSRASVPRRPLPTQGRTIHRLSDRSRRFHLRSPSSQARGEHPALASSSRDVPPAAHFAFGRGVGLGPREDRRCALRLGWPLACRPAAGPKLPQSPIRLVGKGSPKSTQVPFPLPPCPDLAGTWELSEASAALPARRPQRLLRFWHGLHIPMDR